MRGWTGALIGLLVLLSLHAAWQQDLSFDGALNMQVPAARIAHGRYATTYDGLHDFHPAVQTGPTLLFPAEWALRLRPQSSLAAQVPNVVYMAIFGVLVVAVGRRLGGHRSGAVLALLLTLVVPGLYDFGLRGYGEVPALCFLLGGIALLASAARPARPGLLLLAGTCFGLAYLSKTVMLIAVPALLAAWIYALCVSRRFRVRDLLPFAIGILAVVAAWEAFKYVSLGADGWQAWWSNQSGAIAAQSGASNAMPDTPGMLNKLLVHLDRLAEATNTAPGLLILYLLVPYAVLAVLYLPRLLDRERPISPALIVVAGTAATYLVWWLLVTPTYRAWPRRIFPGLLLHALLCAHVVTVLAASLAAAPREMSRCIASRAALLALLAAGATHVFAARAAALLPMPVPPAREAQTIAAAVRALPPAATVYTRGWWQAPLVAFLSGRDFRDLDRVAADALPYSDGVYTVIDSDMRVHVAPMVDDLLARSDHELVARAGDYALYRLTRVYRFPPFRAAAQERAVGPKVPLGDAALVHGLRRDPGGYMWAQPVSAFLVRRADETHAVLRAWFPPFEGYTSQPVRLRLLVNGVEAGRWNVEEDGEQTFTAPIPAAALGDGKTLTMECHVNQMVYHPDGGARAEPWVMVVMEAGLQ